MPIFDRNHLFFPEALTYAVAQVGLTFVHFLRNAQSLPTKNFILNRGRVVDSILRNTEEVLVALGVGALPSRLIYDEADASGVTTGQRPPDFRLPPEVWTMLSQVCIGSAYERVKDRINEHYGKDPWQWPRELDYFHHVRNGCFHDNVFDLRPYGKQSTSIDASRPPRWRTSVLVDDTSVGGKRVFGGVLESGDVPVLLGDIAIRLQQDRVF